MNEDKPEVNSLGFFLYLRNDKGIQRVLLSALETPIILFVVVNIESQIARYGERSLKKTEDRKVTTTPNLQGRHQSGLFSSLRPRIINPSLLCLVGVRTLFNTTAKEPV